MKAGTFGFVWCLMFVLESNNFMPLTCLKSKNSVVLANLLFFGLHFLLFGCQIEYSQQITFSDCSDCASLPKPIRIPTPEYPKEAKEKRISGNVTVTVTINEYGNVIDVGKVSGDDMLRQSAIEASRKAKFQPALTISTPSKAVKAVAQIVYKFVLDEPILTRNNQKGYTELFKAPISLGILNDRAIYLPQPIYPKAVLRPRSQGDVIIQIKLNVQEGKLVLAKAVSGNLIFRKYAEEAAMKAKFQPKNIEGSPLFANGVLVFKHPSKEKTVNDTKTPKVLPIIVVGVVNKRAIYLPKPTFPTGCRCQGTIKVRIVVDESGRVTDASANEGHPLLQAGSIQAARQTKFSPTLINGGRIYVVAFLEYIFSPNGQVKV
ncbi:MAG: TonB family protein [Saprospiraceae bacterium]|nr:TonB family protein [Pyrinomonadaceae bacterium]